MTGTSVKTSASGMTNTAGGGLYMRRAGRHGPPAVLVHGLASSSAYWLRAASMLGVRHRIYMPDLLGFGRSPKPSTAAYGPDDHIAALDLALQSAGAPRPFSLIGQSAGSLVALSYAAASPSEVRRLVLISLPVIGCVPWGHHADGSPRLWHRLSAHTDFGSAGATLVLRLITPIGRLVAPRLQRDVPPAAARAALSLTARSYWRTLENVVYAADVLGLLDGVTAPVLLIHGEHDRTAPLEPVRALAAARPNLCLFVVPDAGHNPLISHQTVVLEAIERFLDEAG